MERQWLVDWAVPHSRADKPEQMGSETDCTTPGSSAGKESFKASYSKKPVGIVAVGETPSLIGEFIGEAHKILELRQNHPPGNQQQKGPVWLWVVGEVTESETRVEQVGFFPL